MKWAYLDGGALDGLSEEWFYAAILREITGTSERVLYAQFVERLREIAVVSLVIVILDEFELIAANPQFGISLFNRLRG